MRKYIINRCIHLIPILLGITFLSFCLMHITQDDTIDFMYKQGAVTEEVKTAKRVELGLDKPFIVQYTQWLDKVLTGNMGESFISGQSVAKVFLEKLPATMELMLASLLLTLLLAIPLGIYTAVWQNTYFDYIFRLLSFIGNSLPNFFTALLLIYFLSLKMGILPIMQMENNWQSIIMPALTLAISMGAKYMRQIRSLVLEELEKPYVLGARARGISEKIIIWNQVLKCILPAIITLAALSCGSLLGGTVIVESIFMWDGIGKMAIDAILARDYPVIQIYVLWMAIIYVLVNLLADIIHQYLDPRVQGLQKDRNS